MTVSETRQLLIDTLARIAYLADAGTPEEYVAHFTDDASWEVTAAEGLPIQAGTIQGRDALLQGVHERRGSGVQGPGTFTAHEVSNTFVDISECGTHATAKSLFKYYRNIHRTPELVAVGRYIDQFEYVGGVWKLASRKIIRE